jgi:uncharacterized membrane protein
MSGDGLTARPGASLEVRIARLLSAGTLAAVALLAIGCVVLLATGRSPLDVAPSLDPGRIPADIASLQPAGFLWLGLLAVVATPGARVAAALVGYARQGEREMAIVSGLILVVIAAGVAAGTLGA